MLDVWPRTPRMDSKMILTRPLFSIDIETHAFVAPENSHIIEMGVIGYYPDGTTKEFHSLFKPPIPITQEATDKHGITNEMVKDAPAFKGAGAQRLAATFTDCDFCGYNVLFDLRVLQGELTRSGIPWRYRKAYLLDGYALWKAIKPRTLEGALKEFLDREPRQAHRALEDAKDAYDVFLAMLDRFGLNYIPETIHKMCFKEIDDSNWVDPDGKFIWDNNEVICNFGENGKKKTPLRQMSSRYLKWILNSDFSPEVKELVKNALNNLYPTRS